MSTVISNAELLLDDLRHSLARPQVCGKPVRFRSLLEKLGQTIQIALGNPSWPPRSSNPPQCVNTLQFQRISPTSDRLSADTNRTRHLCLRPATTQQLGCLHSTTLQFSKVPLHPCWISHALNIGPSVNIVTILCKTQ